MHISMEGSVAGIFKSLSVGVSQTASVWFLFTSGKLPYFSISYFIDNGGW